MINNLESKSKKELLEIVQIQIEEYAKLQTQNNEAQSLIGLLEVEVGKLKRGRDVLKNIITEQAKTLHLYHTEETFTSLAQRDLEQQAKGVKDLKALLNGADWEDSELQMYLHHHIEDMKQQQAEQLNK